MTEENPFKHRWKLDDPQWLKQRKHDWKYVKENLKERGYIKTKALKYFKEFFVEGIEPPEYIGNYVDVGFTPVHRLAFTPSQTEEDVLEIFSNTRPDYYSELLGFGMWGGGVTPYNPFGYAGGQEKIIAKALFPDVYKEETVDVNCREYKKYIPAVEFIYDFERAAYTYLTDTVKSRFFPVQYHIEHFISCVKQLEEKGEEVSHHEWFPNFLSCIFNFVEPHNSWGMESNAANFAENFRKKILQDDVPKTIKKAIDTLGPNRILEFKRDNPPEYSPFYGFSGAASPMPRIMHGISNKDALKVFFNSAKHIELVDRNDIVLDYKAVNISPLISDGLVSALGYQQQNAIPAYRFLIWFTPSVRISNDSTAKFGAEIFLFHHVNNIEKNFPCLIYYPRLSSYYNEWCSSDTLFLKERQLRREIFDRCSKHLLRYYPDQPSDHLPNYFDNNPTIAADYRILRDYKSGTMELAIEGPDVLPWEGEPLPPLDLEDILIDE